MLERQLFSPSDIVEEGDVLFIIEQEQYQAARDEAVALMRSAVADSETRLKNSAWIPTRSPWTCSKRRVDRWA